MTDPSSPSQPPGSPASPSPEQLLPGLGSSRLSGSPPRSGRRFPGLLEGLVAGSILVSLAGVVIPALGTGAEASRLNRAQEDLIEIAEGLSAWSHDTLFLPTGRQGRTNLAWLYGPGELPLDNPFVEGGDDAPLSQVLLQDTLGGERWAGPYAAALTPDPWGHAYLVNAEGWLDPRERALVLSAGPNGRVETDPTSTRPGGDDVIYLIE